MTTGRAIALMIERLVEPVEGMHRVIATRNFRSVGPLGRPIQRVHDAVAAAVYATIRHGAFLVGAVVDHGSSKAATADENSMVSFVNAVWGDELGHREPTIGLAMAATTATGDRLPQDGHPGDATAHPVLLIHGLGQTAASWRDDTEGDLVDLLHDEPGVTPLLVSYNTGRSVAANGTALATLLESIVQSWPVPVERVTLVGHSLGGLVARSACLTGLESAHDWPDLVTDLITVGAPHRGAPAEKAANAGAWSLGIARTTRPLAQFINRRSRGIKDLRFGALRDSDWGETHHDALLQDTVGEHALPSDIAHHVIAATVTDDVGSVWATALGDGMVRKASATTPPGSRPATKTVLGGVGHSSLQRSAAVHDVIINLLRSSEPS